MTRDELETDLRTLPDLREVSVVGNGTVVATVVSGSFSGQDEAQRQAAVWSLSAADRGSGQSGRGDRSAGGPHAHGDGVPVGLVGSDRPDRQLRSDHARDDSSPERQRPAAARAHRVPKQRARPRHRVRPRSALAAAPVEAAQWLAVLHAVALHARREFSSRRPCPEDAPRRPV